MSLLDGGMLALKSGQQHFANQYDRNRQEATLQIAREQQDNANAEAQRLARKDEATQTVGAINSHFGKMGAQWNKTDATKLLAEKPELVLSMLNDAPSKKYREFINEEGNSVGAQIVKMIENDDKSYTPMVRRNDTGAIVPMTEGRSAENTPVVKLTKGNFENIVNSRYQAAIVDGGLENTGSFLATAEGIVANAAKQESLVLAAEELKDPDERAQFYAVLNDIDIEDPGATEELLKVYQSLGGDPEALRTAGQEKADALFAKQQEEAGENTAKTPAGRFLAGGDTQQRKGALGKNERELMNLYGLADRSDFGLVEKIRDAIDEKGVSGLGGKSGYFKEQTDESLAANTAAEDFYADKANMGFVAKALNRNPELLEEFNSLGPAEFLNKYKKDGGIEFPEMDPNNVGMFANSKKLVPPAPFELTADNLKTAIIDGTSSPTADQADAIAGYLKDNGIDNDADLAEAIRLKKVNKKEGLMLAWVMGATAEGDTNVKSQIAQKITNLVERGDQDVGTLEQAQLESAVVQGQAASLTARAKYDEVQFKLRKYDQEAVADIQLLGNTALDSVYKKLGLMDAEGEFTDDEFDGDEDDAKYISQAITKFIPRLKQAKGPVSAAAGMQYLNPMLSLYLQSQANADKAGIFGVETYKDFFRLNPDGTTDFDLANVRVAKVKDGKPVSIAYVDQEGVRSQAVDIAAIQKDSKAVARLLVLAATTNGQESEYKDKGS